MGINSVKLESVQKVKQISILSLSELKSLKRGLNQTLLEMSLEWDDSKKKEFEEIVYSIKDSLNSPIKELERINPLLQEIIQIIEEYESITFVTNGIAGAHSGREGARQTHSEVGERPSEFGSPHFFEKTQEGWIRDYDTMYYDSPFETGRRLNSNQGVPVSQGGEGVEGFEGTCGLVSCENVLLMAGVNVTEADIVNYARQTSAGLLGLRRLCTVNSSPESNGGTYLRDRQQILRHFGIESTIENATIDGIARRVSEGRGVIISVEANAFWERYSNSQAYHAVTVTSVRVDSQTGCVMGFYVCDSGTNGNDSARYVERSVMENALQPYMNVTTEIIR